MRVRLLHVALTASLAVSACAGGDDYPKNRRPFDAQRWAAGLGDDRCEMVDDLRDRVGLEGRSRQEVTALVGPPEPDGHSQDHYHLCPSFMDIWILEIQWDNDRVASTRVRDT